MQQSREVYLLHITRITLQPPFRPDEGYWLFFQPEGARSSRTEWLQPDNLSLTQEIPKQDQTYKLQIDLHQSENKKASLKIRIPPNLQQKSCQLKLSNNAQIVGEIDLTITPSNSIDPDISESPIPLGQIEMSQLQIGNLLYRSPTGQQEIYDGILIPTDQQVIIKYQYCYSQYELEQFDKETRAICQLDHPNIIKCYGWALDERSGNPHRVMILEKCTGGDLFTAIANRRNEMNLWDEGNLWLHMAWLIDAFEKMQFMKIVHSDIKPQNIVIGQSGVLKIIDFGVSLVGYQKMFQNTSTLSVAGTVAYFSPRQMEAYMDFIRGMNPRGIVKHNPYKSDVFSLGLTFLHMCSLQQPDGLNDFNNKDLQVKIYGEIDKIQYGEFLKYILRIMLQVNQNERPDFSELAKIIREYSN